MPTPSTGGVKFLEYTQTVPADTWTIYHAFGAHPIVDTNVNVNGVITKAFPTAIEHLDENTVIVRWTIARRGTATLVCTV